MIPLLLVASVLAADAPYVRTHVDPSNPQSHCLWWPAGEVLWQQSQAGHPASPGDTDFTSVEAAFGSWQALQVQCGNLSLDEGPRTASRQVGYTGQNDQNVVLYREQRCADVVPSGDACLAADECGNAYDCWDHPSDAVALTTTTYDVNTGQILDADIELNAASFFLTTADSPACPSGFPSQSCVAYDIQATATHEVGHLLGLDHTSAPGSLMNVSTSSGDLSKRTIDDGTAQFVCDAYPKGQPSQDCVAGGGGGGTGGPGATASDGGCSAAGADPAILLALLGLVRRRRR